MPDLSQEPTSFRAGDTVTWSKSLEDYPATTWTLKYRLINADSAQTEVTATADGSDFDVEITAAISAAYPAGMYRLTGWVTDGTDRHTIYEGDCEVFADLAAATAGVDTRSHVKKVLDALEAMIEGRASKSQSDMSIGNRTISLLSPTDLRRERQKYLQLYKRELRKQAIAEGRAPGNRHLVTFTTPS